MRPGDILVIYRTKDNKGPAEYRSVVTSVCVVEEMKPKNHFNNFKHFYDYCRNYSIFSQAELSQWYNHSENIYTIKMTYNAALNKRLTRGKLIEEIGIERNAYAGFMKLTDDQFRQICRKGGINESLIID
ncbi:hypothetical protein [Geosporobacter ferrireducens]|uniref:EVE domain-containing protein n=1 Tax=Geosporobacter ferrireducens TaxID=1424294 RepID=A0A1D8GMT7_9FIRM|nr:hypothetical protein [Geosporobacter ferrireducens]AOT72218.1 hypothetical protein Gferi_23345 [Geosporobacter ferrireducens]MTI56112.1 hypothetical protein [Geosporobacter ferrireducens]